MTVQAVHRLIAQLAIHERDAELGMEVASVNQLRRKCAFLGAARVQPALAALPPCLPCPCPALPCPPLSDYTQNVRCAKTVAEVLVMSLDGVGKVFLFTKGGACQATYNCSTKRDALPGFMILILTDLKGLQGASSSRVLRPSAFRYCLPLRGSSIAGTRPWPTAISRGRGICLHYASSPACNSTIVTLTHTDTHTHTLTLALSLSLSLALACCRAKVPKHPPPQGLRSSGVQRPSRRETTRGCPPLHL